MFLTAMCYTPDHDDATLHGDAASAAAAGGETVKVDVDKAAMDAFKAGIAEGAEQHVPGQRKASEEEEEEDEGEAAGDGGAGDTATDDGVDDKGKKIKPKAPAAKPAEKPADKAGAPAGDGEQDDVKPDAEIEKEIAAGGMKGPTAERFRDLANFKREAEPVVAALKELGIEKVEDIAALRVVAEHGVTFSKVMEQSQATEDQFARSFSYIAAVNSGDPVLMRQAFDAMENERQWLAKELGIAIPGAKAGEFVVDPLDADPALKARVVSGEVPRDVAERAMEARRATELGTARTKKQGEATTAATAEQNAVAAVQAVGVKLAAEDAEGFKAKQVILGPAVRLIQSKSTPDKWASEIEALFRATPTPTAAPKPKPKPPAPLRPNASSRDGTFIQKPGSDMDAFSLGLAAAREQGRGG